MPDPKQGNDSNASDENIDLSFMEEEGTQKPNQSDSKTKPGTTPEFRILPKFSNLPKEEAIIRSAQSAITILSQEVNRLHETVDESLKYKHLFEQIEEDPLLRKAYFKKLEPELFKGSSNVEELVKQKLMEEYKDFTPDPAEAGIYGSETYKYNRRAATLEKELSQTDTVIPELEEILATKKSQREALTKEAMKEINDLKQIYGWDDEGINNMFKFFKTLKIKNMGVMYNFVTKKGAYKPPSSKGKVPATTSDTEQYIHKLLGPPVSGPTVWNK